MLKLDNKNGLYNFVNNLIESGMEMYLDKRNGKGNTLLWEVEARYIIGKTKNYDCWLY